jgi:hypothetical protein
LEPFTLTPLVEERRAAREHEAKLERLRRAGKQAPPPVEKRPCTGKVPHPAGVRT